MAMLLFKLLPSAASTLVFTTLSLTSFGSAYPTNDQSYTSLIEPVPPPGKGIYIWLSSITTTFYGEPSDSFDCQQVGSDLDSCIESAETLKRIFPEVNRDSYELMVAFLNATQGGTMTDVEAANRHWLCNELGPRMAPETRACMGIEMTAWDREEL